MGKTKKPEAKKAGKTKGKEEPAEELTEAQAAAAGPEVDTEEAEEQAEAANFQKSSSNEAEAAAGEVSLSFKNFRHHPEMENFYRFIYENDLRYEALAIIDQLMIAKGVQAPAAPQKKAAKASKSKSH